MDDSQSDLFDEDFEAATEALNCLPEDARRQEGVLEKLARLHAEWGDRRFRLRFCMRAPRNEFERSLQAQHLGFISSEECTRRCRAYEESSLDEETLSSLRDDLHDKIVFYSRALQTVISAEQSAEWKRSRLEAERLVGRYVREMEEPVSLSGPRFQRVVEFLEECRIERGLPMPTLGERRCSTATLLTFDALNRAADYWQKACQTAERSRADRRYSRRATATELFHTSMLPSLPNANDLLALLNEEIALGRIALRGRSASTPDVQVAVTNHVHMPPPHILVKPEITVAPQIHVGESERRPDKPSSVRPDSPSARMPRTGETAPKFKNWAVGIDAKRIWWLFHHREGRWEQRKKVRIPAGDADCLMLGLAESHGLLTSAAAVALLQDRLNRKSGLKSATNGLAKAKRAICKAIAECSNCSVESIGNPIPNIKSAWRAEIEIGFALPDERSGHLKFTRREHMGID